MLAEPFTRLIRSIHLPLCFPPACVRLVRSCVEVNSFMTLVDILFIIAVLPHKIQFVPSRSTQSPPLSSSLFLSLPLLPILVVSTPTSPPPSPRSLTIACLIRHTIHAYPLPISGARPLPLLSVSPSFPLVSRSCSSHGHTLRHRRGDTTAMPRWRHHTGGGRHQGGAVSPGLRASAGAVWVLRQCRAALCLLLCLCLCVCLFIMRGQ